MDVCVFKTPTQQNQLEKLVRDCIVYEEGFCIKLWTRSITLRLY